MSDGPESTTDYELTMTEPYIPWSLASLEGLTVPNPSIHAVHDDDLIDVLESLGLARAFKMGDLHCKFCGVVVDDTNLYSIFPDSGDIKVACDKAECVMGLLRHTNRSRATG